MRTVLLFLCLFLMLPDCQQQAGEATTLPDDKIARIMADLHIAEAATNGLAGYPKDSLMHAYFRQVYEMHGTDSAGYQKDLRIIGNDLPRLQSIVLQSIKLLDEDGKKTGQPAK